MPAALRSTSFFPRQSNRVLMVLGTLGILVILSATPGLAQVNPATPSPAQATPTGTNPLFAPLPLTAPSDMRLANGTPGPKYWQNRADYDLAATLDTVAQVLRGSMVLRYTNNSPNTLDFIWLQTVRARVASDTLGDTTHLGRGDIETFNQQVSGQSVPLKLEGHQSVTKVLLAQPLKPGETATFESTWFLKQPRSHIYQVIFWYPRMAIYDDVHGWNSAPPGTAIYLEYGDFTVTITVPSNYIVGGTGTLDNPTEVLPAPIAAKLARATTADTVVHIITRNDLKNGKARPKNTGMLTWKFHAKNVINVEWAAADDYLWDGVSWNGILNQTLHRVGSPATWKHGAKMVQRSIQEYSEHWGPYPYPQITVMDAKETGYAFPMSGIVTYTPELEGMGLPNLHFSILTHEVGHQWFPMVVGSSEVAHLWMSEGFATFIQAWSEKRWYPEEFESMDAWQKLGMNLLGAAVIESAGPLESTGGGAAEATDAYGAPAGALYILRQFILSPEVFDQALREYRQRWAYKHPTPADFFRTIEDVSKRKLDWFWREWFYSPQTYDVAIDSVTQTRQGNETQIAIRYRNIGTGVLPVLVTLTYSDGSQEKVVQPPESWEAGPVQTVNYSAHNKTLTKVQIDASDQLPDADRANNTWPKPAP